MRNAARGGACLLAILVFGASCNPAPPSSTENALLKNRFTGPGSLVTENLPRGVAAYVNNEVVSVDLFAAYQYSKKSQQANTAESPHEQLNELINLRLLVQKARQEKLDQAPQLRAQFELQIHALTAQTYLDQLAQQQKIAETDLKHAYQKYYVETPTIEYKARHILVKTHKEADEIMRALALGEDFATLAKKHSNAPDASFGGALEWFRPEEVDKHFARAVQGLGENELSHEPIKTSHGWHILWLESKRNARIPAFSEVRTALHQRLRQEQIEKHLRNLREHSQIKINPTGSNR